ncbi:MAG: hypothetical protein GY837_18145 [Bosea sp.]|nr:hypothetical protein [Bosea sp. (in: a-proteobacteria)]
MLSFVEHHHPPMPPGEYELSITQHVGLPGVQDSFLHKAAFAVGGERFALDPAEIDSVFPPQSAQGEFFNVLPHVVITRRTLPWERSLADSASPPSGLTPWLALLVFDQGEAVTGPKAMTVLDLVGADVHPGGRLPAGTVSYDGLGRLDPGESYDDPCQVVDLDLTLFQSLAPTRKDLAWLAHGRVASTARKAGPLGTSAASVQDYAIVVASRLPRMGSRSLACLVSLEGLDAWLPGPGARSPGPAGRIRLVCLTSWAFHTLAEPETFNECLTALDRAALRPDARSAGVPSDDGDAYLGAVANLGYLPLSHQLRDGGTAVSWYRGPLAPLATPRTVTVPVDSADAALRQDPATGMLDVSYATAWQIGRLLALQDRVFSTALYRWKTATRRETVAQAERELLGRCLGQAVAAGDLRTVAAASLGGRLGAALEKPAATTSPAPLQPAASSPTAPPPAMVSEWLARLRLLKGVPFPHLVPDEAMLPPESVRFFQLDFNWIDCLADGAYSLGRFTTGDRVHDEDLAGGVQDATAEAARALARSEAATGPLEEVSGLLLRSRAVSFWPGMEIEGRSRSGERLQVLRFEALSPTVLIALFEGTAEEIDLHEPPEAIHFGVDLKVHGGEVSKLLRGAAATVPVSFRGEGRVLKIDELATAIKTALRSGPFTAAEFAREMVEGVGKVTFKRSGATS